MAGAAALRAARPAPPQETGFPARTSWLELLLALALALVLALGLGLGLGLALGLRRGLGLGLELGLPPIEMSLGLETSLDQPSRAWPQTC